MDHLRVCSPEMFLRVTSDRLPFDVRVGRLEIQEGDTITFQDPDGRTTIRRVDMVLYSDDLENLEGAGCTVTGISRGLAGPLACTFGGGGVSVGFGIERRAHSTEIIQGPQCLPALICPPVDPRAVLDQLHDGDWPDGVYTILVAGQTCEPEAGRIAVTVREHLVMTLANVGGTDMFMEVDQRMLQQGVLQDMYGKTLAPYFGQEPDQEDEDATGPQDRGNDPAEMDDSEKGDNQGGLG